MATRRIFPLVILLGFGLMLITSCDPKDMSPENYTITYEVSGSSLNQINFHSHQLNFDVTNVPTHHWASTNTLLGGDTITLYASQGIADSITPVIVTLKVAHYGSPDVIYSDTNAVGTSVSAYLYYKYQ